MSPSRHASRKSAHETAPRMPFSGTRWEIAAFSTLLVFLAICLLGGGSSRGDTLSLIYVRPAAVLCIAVLLVLPVHRDWRSVRWPLLCLGASACLILIQLIPLPPDIWLALPGREPFAEAATLAGLPQPWRPISVTPDYTREAFLWLLPPVAVLVGFASIRPEQRATLLPAIVVMGCLSALLGVIQLSGGNASPAYFYRHTHLGVPVGFLANRNHEAVFLALTFPLLAAWAQMPGRIIPNQRFRILLAGGIAALMVPSILLTGSRAGLALGALGLAAGVAMIFRKLGRTRSQMWRLGAGSLLIVTPLVLAALAFTLSRAMSIDRLVGQNIGETEMRLRNLPVVLDLARDFLPLGAGFGSFDAVYRMVEPDAFLASQYFNRAHNDLLELVIVAGIPGLLILIAFLFWLARSCVRAFRRQSTSPNTLLARAGAIGIFMLLLASLVDYPLGTPFLSGIFAILCAWLQQVDSFREKSGHLSDRDSDNLLNSQRGRSYGGAGPDAEGIVV